MSRKLAGWLTLLAVSGGTMGWYAMPRPGSDSGHEERMSLGQAFGRGIDLTGFAHVEQPREFRFPDDHGPHPDYRTEWWYYTGNLRSADGRRFGFQLTFFRSALRAPAQRPERASAWAAEQVYMAHFAVSDVAAGGFHEFERFNRGALGLAGAQAVPFRVWLEDWSVAAADRGASGRQPTLRLRARAGRRVAGPDPAGRQAGRGARRARPEPQGRAPCLILLLPDPAPVVRGAARGWPGIRGGRPELDGSGMGHRRVGR